MHEVSFFEKDPEQSNLWKRTYISTEEIRNTNPALAARIQSWLAKNGGRTFQGGDGMGW